MGSGSAATCLNIPEKRCSKRRALSRSTQGDYQKTRQLRHGSTAPDALYATNSSPWPSLLLTNRSLFPLLTALWQLALPSGSARVGRREKHRIFKSLKTSIEKKATQKKKKKERMTDSSAQWSLSFPLSEFINCLNYELFKKFKPTLCTSCSFSFISAGIYPATQQIVSLYAITRLNSSFFIYI